MSNKNNNFFKISKFDAVQNLPVILDLSINQDFFELLRRIDRSWKDNIRLGDSNDKYPMKIRIDHPADMSFATREVVSVRQIHKYRNILPSVYIESRHFGLFSPYGPMPIYVTEHARSEIILKKNKAFERFMAILSQRLAIFQYRAWAQLHVAVGYDKEKANPFKNRLDQLIGLGLPMYIMDHIAKLRRSFPGAYLIGKKSFFQLQKILSKYFQIPVSIIKNQASWIYDSDSSKYQKMGKIGNVRLGKRIYDVEHSATINVGPFFDISYEDFSKAQDKLNLLIDICNDFVNYLVKFNVYIIIKLNKGYSANLNKARIGNNSWLKPNDNMYKKLVYKINSDNFYEVGLSNV